MPNHIHRVGGYPAGWIRTNLHRLITEEDLSIAQFSKRLISPLSGVPSITKGRLYDIFADRRGPITWDELYILAGALNCTLFELVAPPTPEDEERGASNDSGWDHLMVDLFGMTSDHAATAQRQTREGLTTTLPDSVRRWAIRQHPGIRDEVDVVNRRLYTASEHFTDPVKRAAAFAASTRSRDEFTEIIEQAIAAGEMPDPNDEMLDLFPPLPFDPSDIWADEALETDIREKVRLRWDDLLAESEA